MKASELQDKLFFKALIYGDAGVGKTCLAAQMPGPIEYWDFDHKIGSAIQYLKKTGNQAKLDEIDVYQFGHLKVKERIPEFEKRTKIIDDAISKKQPFAFKTLVIDSITTLSNYIMEDYIYRSQLGIKRPIEGINSMQDYQLYEKHMMRLLLGLLGQDINLVVLGHINIDKDETTGALVKKPLVKGQAISPMLPMWFEEVYAAYTKPDGSRVLQTGPGNNYATRTQRGFPKEIPMTIEALGL